MVPVAEAAVTVPAINMPVEAMVAVDAASIAVVTEKDAAVTVGPVERARVENTAVPVERAAATPEVVKPEAAGVMAIRSECRPASREAAAVEGAVARRAPMPPAEGAAMRGRAMPETRLRENAAGRQGAKG